MEQQQNVDLTVINLPPSDRAAIVLDSSTTEKKLREMVASSAGILTVIDKAGREEAHSAAMALRGVRTTIAKTGKAAREDAQAFAKAVISEEARLIGIDPAAIRNEDADISECGELIAAGAEPVVPLRFSYDGIGDVLTIEGVDYHGSVFRELGGMLPIGVPFILIARDAGGIAIQRIDQAAA